MPAPTSVSVIVPVKDGARYLGELLSAVTAQAAAAPVPVDVLVVDSGSSDRSLTIAREHNVEVLSIPPASFGHGVTRNLAAERTTGDVIAFLTQDATPLPGWLDAILEGFALADDVGAVYGPHTARADTSPMIARELAAFFEGHASVDGSPEVQRSGGNKWLSNVNAAYRRDCWAQVRFDAVAYSEDQAFGVAMLAAGWAKVYHPGAAVAHAHDYPPAQFARRYFDEYRGLRQTIGHVEALGVRSALRDVRTLVADDRAWMRAQEYDEQKLRDWTRRAIVHHTGRKLFSGLGSRAHRLPVPLQRRLSLEGTVVRDAPPAAGMTPGHDGPVVGKPIDASGNPLAWDGVRLLAKHGPASLLDPLPGQETEAPLHLAVVIPPFSEGSGGHNSIFQIMSRLERMGHTVSYWIHDPMQLERDVRPARIRRRIRAWFAPIEGPVFKGFAEWYGADVVIATGWQTAHEVMRLRGCRSRAYLVHDHESMFYATSVESMWAEETYGLGMHAICSSPWLQEMVATQHGGTTSRFDFGVDHDVYLPRPVKREGQTVIVYGRYSTPRRAVTLALMALQELTERRPDLKVMSFGSPEEIDMPFPYEHLGVLNHRELSWAFSQATVGLVLSLTNYSLIPQEMLACGLPCVDLAGVSAEGVFGTDGPVTLSPPDPLALADAIERLLDDRAAWKQRSQTGLSFVAERTWDRAAEQVQDGLREAVRLRLAAVSAVAETADAAPSAA